MTDFNKYIISDTLTVKEALVALNDISNDVLTLFVVDSGQRMSGTLTDGDIRRGLIAGTGLEDRVDRVMRTDFSYILDGGIDVEEIIRLKKRGVKIIPCLDREGRITGVYNFNRIRSVLPVDAVLMAGGKGERLRPLTETVPKPLLPLGEKPIIDHNTDSLLSYGITNISVTVNYLKEQIEEHFVPERGGIRIKCVREPKYLGTIGSVKFVEDLKNDTVLVMNSDVFTNLDFEDFFLHFRRNEADMSIAAVPYSVNVPYGIFDLEGREIKGILEKPTYNYYANAGIYLIRRELLRLIPEDSFYNATDFIDMLVERGHKVIRFPITGYWIDIGKHEEYRRAQDFAKHMGK